MESSGLLSYCGSLEAIKPSRNRFDAGLCPLEDFYSTFQILNEENSSGNGRVASDFDNFLAWIFLVLELINHKILAVWTVNIYADRFHTLSIRLDRIPRPSGIPWKEFDFFGLHFSASYTKSVRGPLVCGILGVNKCPLDMSQKYI
jgi:hypothetical protein